MAKASGISLDPDLFSLHIVEISGEIMKGPEQRIFHSAEMEPSGAMQDLLAEVKRVKPQRLVRRNPETVQPYSSPSGRSKLQTETGTLGITLWHWGRAIKEQAYMKHHIGARKQVLLVDDEVQILDSSKISLQLSGIREVLTLSDSRSFSRLFRSVMSRIMKR